ncbi:MAG: hypothetical protein ACD_20C00137G0013 [uncultured bacterium]|nr:MAG: hypothetical protein ACD_20C00137G0013 [uncultured bacterium]HBH19070.1 hypothetical protein [Cyanobacteria bacterium UBA9579]
MNRVEFVTNAGGVFKTNKGYKGLNGTDKDKIFWGFHSKYQDSHGIYSGVPTDQLILSNQKSIEHVTPKSVLQKYLRRTSDKATSQGATVNPFNLFPADRDINSKRGNSPFDFDGDKVVVKFTSPKFKFKDFGLDKDNEWVIPKESRGDIARSILYMNLVYNLKKIYGNKTETLKQWAIQDPPSKEETDYNEWVKKNIGIQNPFLSPNGKELLKDERLLEELSSDKNSSDQKLPEHFHNFNDFR